VSRLARELDVVVESLVNGDETDASELTAIEAELERGREQLEELRAQRTRLDAGDQTGRLIDRIDGLLVSAESEGLDDQDLLVLDAQRLSVGQVHAGIRTRADEIRHQPLPDELRSLDRAVSAMQRRVASLGILVARVGDFVRQRELVAEAEREVTTAIERVETSGQRNEAFASDNQRLGQLEEKIDRLTGELSDIYTDLGLEGRSVEDARADLDAALAALDVADETALPAAEREARASVDTATAALQEAGEKAAALRRTVAVTQATLDGVAAALAADRHWSWLFPTRVEGTASDATAWLERFADGRTKLLRLEERIDAAERLLEGFPTVAHAALAADTALIGDTERARAVAEVLGEELRVSLDRPAIRRALFDDAAIVGVDPVAGELTLEGPDGRSTRPFESYSTGEQAFAFTQARIRELVPPTAPNRLLVLDEFGAFVSVDRLPMLTEFLTQETLGAICDQVLVILPLQVDYASDLEFTTGSLADRYRDRAGQVEKRGYLTAPLP
jgi:hypothetical protein